MNKTIKGYEGLYEVSDGGKIYSCDRWIQRGNIPAFWRGREMTPVRGDYGYLVVMLSKEGNKKIK